MSLKIVGFCRFSFFGPSDTKLSYDDRDEAFRTLYAPARMETRFRLFEHLFLPSIAAQIDKDFRLIVLSSACMPAPYQARLSALCKTVEQIELVFSESEGLQNATRPYTIPQSLKGDSLLQFCIDDDDALSCTYIERLRAWSPLLMDEMILTLPNGLMLYDLGEGPTLAPMHRPMTGAGFAWFSETGTRRNVFNFSHITARRRYVTMSDPTITSFIQTFTPSADTARLQKHKISEFLKGNGIVRKHKRGVNFVVRESLAQDFPHFAVKHLEDLLHHASHDVHAQG